MVSYGKRSWAQRRWQPERMAVYLFTVAGIRVNIHLYSIIVLAFELLSAAAFGMVGATLAIAGMLFLFVLLHEFGHCFGARAVGGSADDILMWPLGGLASTDPPDRPWEHLVTIVCGPAVNVAFCALLFPFLVYNGASALGLLNPFASVYEQFGRTWWPFVFAYRINYWLFVFNVFLPVFPLDGGQILRDVLWFRAGKFRATFIACNVGLFAGAIVGLVALYNQNLLLFGIMLWCFVTCYQMRMFLHATAMEQGGAFYDSSQGYRAFDRDDDDERPPKRPGFMARWRAKRDERRREAEAEFDSEIDRILAKVNDHGLASLTNREKRMLNEASERQRKRGR